MDDQTIPNAEQIWQQALGELQLQMTKATFNTWLKNTVLLRRDNGVFTIGAPNAHSLDWLENRLQTAVKRTLMGIVGHPVDVRFEMINAGTSGPTRETLPKEQQEIEVRPVYLSARSAIVQPDRVAAATVYFRDRWLPLLGALRWSLVVVLRGLATDAPPNADGTRQVKTDRNDLAHRLGVTPRTISRLLKTHPLKGQRPWRAITPENEQAEYLSLFILRLKYRAVREDNVTRRTGLLLDVLMEDPLTPSDQELASSMTGAVASNVTESGAKGQTVPLHATGSAKEQNVALHDEGVKRQNVASQGAKRQNIPLHTETAKGQNVTSQGAKGQNVRGNVNVNELTNYLDQLDLNLTSKRQIRTVLKPIVTTTEELLDDHHSAAMLYKVLLALYPHHLELFSEAVEEALTIGESDLEANLGAIFVAALKELAEDANVELGLRSS